MLRVKGWTKFQHYKERRPAWIKLSRELLENYDWHRLQDASKALAVTIWLLAAENEDPEAGTISDDPEWLGFRARMEPKKVIECIKDLIKHGFIERTEDRASDLLAPCYQLATPETETETETEIYNIPTKKSSVERPEDVSEQIWEDFITHRKAKKAKVTKTAIDGIRREAEKAGWTMDAALQEICSRGWQGFKSDWVSKGQRNDRTITSKADRAKEAIVRGMPQAIR